MVETYIKLDRSLLQHRYFDNLKVLKVWMYCLMKASHKPHAQLVGVQSVPLEIGDFVFGRIEAARTLKMSEQNIRTIVKLFENDGKITVKATNKYSIISIVKFETYQIKKYPSNHQSTSNQPAANQELTTNKNGKNVNKETIIPFAPPTPHEVEQYMGEIGYNGNAAQFINHYEENGWKVGGKKKMKDWKASVRTWKSNGYSQGAQSKPPISDAAAETKRRNQAAAAKIIERAAQLELENN